MNTLPDLKGKHKNGRINDYSVATNVKQNTYSPVYMAIGFKPSFVKDPLPVKQVTKPTVDIQDTTDAEFQDLVFNIIGSYVKKRKDQGFAKYADQDLIKMMDKLYIRYFEDLSKDFWK